MRGNARSGRIIALLAALLLAAGCGSVRPKASKSAPEKPAAGTRAGEEDFFRVLTLPAYETAEEAFDKIVILGIPFHEVADEFRAKARAVVREADLP